MLMTTMWTTDFRRWKSGVMVAAVVTGLALTVYFSLRPSDVNTLRQARLALAGRNFAKAETLALSVARHATPDAEAWLIAADAASGAGQWQVSLQYFERVTSGTIKQQSAAAYGRGESCVQLGRLERAQREFQAAIDINPRNDVAKRRLVDLLIFTGRRYAAAPLLAQLVSNSAGTLEDLFILGDLDHLVSRPDAVYAAARNPDADPLLVLGAAVQALHDGRVREARSLFERVLLARPADLDALAGWGQVILVTSPDQLPGWREKLAPEADRDAGVLAVLGQLAEQEERPHIACKRYAAMVTLRPTSRIAWHRLGTSLNHLGRKSEADAALERARQLQQLGDWMNDLFAHRRHLGLIRRVAEKLAKLGRADEAAAWSRHALTVSVDEAWASQLLTQLECQPNALIDAKAEAALNSLLSELTPESVTFVNGPTNPAIGTESPSKRRQPDTDSHQDEVGGHRIRFRDAAPSTGLEFVYRAARNDGTPGARIIETTGGGVGVLDYDGDDWPELYFTQGSRTFPPPPVNPDQDRLFRNRNGQSWEDVSLNARLDDMQFGQGVAVGDFNNDGYSDLYVANLGVNVLYQNQGDGTFQDVTPSALREHKLWTSSCMIADLNGDGAPDLFDVTYCSGDEVETRLCEKQGIPRSCSPRVFGAEVDRLWLNTGDGGWMSAQDGLDLPDGLGLGVVAFRPTPESQLGLFVANDEAPNFWLVNTARQPGSNPVWEDRALSGGAAFDADGQSQACMGVACDDANGDGLPDLFVTNFYHESNTLYLGVNDSLFEDRTPMAGLREPSWNMLGFGTQFLDADLDGWPDLLVANGHIDDLSSSGEPFKMPPQLFRNRGGRFHELTAEEAGDCFAQKALGRGMARLDWNRDSREDAVIVNQESPVALLTNESESTGRPLVLRFRATIGARDAIGTIVRVQLGSRLLTRQLTAGDGYQASNERQLVIGAGEAATVDLSIYWPDGSTQEIKSLPTGMQYILIQGRPQAIPLHSRTH